MPCTRLIPPLIGQLGPIQSCRADACLAKYPSYFLLVSSTASEAGPVELLYVLTSVA